MSGQTTHESEPPRLAAQKCQDFGVEDLGVGDVQSVRSVGDQHQF